MKIVPACFLMFIHLSTVAQVMKPGQWRGDIHYQNAKIPLTFEIGYPNGDTPEFTFINGAERVVVDNAVIRGDSLSIPFHPFDVVINAKFTAMSISGAYVKNYRDSSDPFTATYGKPRMQKKDPRPSPPLGNRLAITFSPESSDMSKGVGLFEKNGNVVTGTVMTKVSDYRYFEGILDGDSLRLSSFDGAHGFAFLGKKTEAGWEGRMIYGNQYEEPWVAVSDPKAALPDPFEMVKLEPGKHKPYYDLLGAGQGKNAIDPSRYEGKVLIIQLFGTWCPNSYDQTKYLVKWRKENPGDEVAILASSFEANYSQEYGLKRLADYRKVNDIPYDLVLGGRLSKMAAAMPFPFMKKIEAFPTLVIVDKQGYARYVHSYFNGPATGFYYEEFDKRFNEIIMSLVAE
ncbi:MAG: TlpA family protein disulfide reductase [Ekhidna sp.]|nr:TlpA family protein disulfide reductase [Ekhidna sp.]